MIDDSQHQPSPASSSLVPTSLSRGSQRLATRSAEQAAIGAIQTQAAAVVTSVGLQGVDMLASQLSGMYERHGDVVLPMAKPIIEGYGKRVRSILDGLQ